MGTPKIQFEKEDLELLAAYFFEQFLPRFSASDHQSTEPGLELRSRTTSKTKSIAKSVAKSVAKAKSTAGLKPGTVIEFSGRMKNKVGLAVLFENKIRLSLHYFLANTQFLPYTIFHEMTHLWLYHQGFDPGHTRRFYQKMLEFNDTGYLIDPEVHVHTRLAAEGRYVYICKNCENRWHLRDELQHNIYCALCYKKSGVEHYASLAVGYGIADPYASPDLPFKDFDECA